MKLQDITKENSYHTLLDYQKQHNYQYLYAITIAKIPNKHHKQSYVNDISLKTLIVHLNGLNDSSNVLVAYNVRNKKDDTHKDYIHYHGIVFSNKPLSPNILDQFKIYNQNIQLENFQYYITPIEANGEQTQEEGLIKFISYIYDKHHISKIVSLTDKNAHTIKYDFSDISAYVVHLQHQVFIWLKTAKNQLIKEKSQCIKIVNLVKGELLNGYIKIAVERGTYEKFNPI